MFRSLQNEVLAKNWLSHLFRVAIRGEKYRLNQPTFSAFTSLFWRSENSFMEMTKKMVHVCENYDNWFLYNPTTNKPVDFVEFLRG
jgi:hypothetical protein